MYYQLHNKYQLQTYYYFNIPYSLALRQKMVDSTLNKNNGKCFKYMYATLSKTVKPVNRLTTPYSSSDGLWNIRIIWNR